MKIFFILLCAVTTSFGQVEMVNKGGVATFEKVIEVEGKSVTDIYKSSIKWISATYQKPEDVTTSKTENELITAQGSDELVFPGSMGLGLVVYSYLMRIDVTDGKARITINFFLINTDFGPKLLESYLYKKDGTERKGMQASGLKKEISQDIDPLVTSFEAHILGKDQKVN